MLVAFHQNSRSCAAAEVMTGGNSALPHPAPPSIAHVVVYDNMLNH